MMVLLKFNGLFTFSHSGNQGGVSLWHFVVVWWYFHVAGQNFEEISSQLNVMVGYLCM